MEDNYFKMWRSVFRHWVSKRKPWCDGFMWCYLVSRANFKERTVCFRGEYIQVKRGEFITSQLKLAEIAGWSRKRVKTFLRALENDKMATTEGTTRWTRIIICNYNEYQWFSDGDHVDGEQQKEQQKVQVRDNRGTTEGQQRDTDNKDKKEENEENEKKKNTPLTPLKGGDRVKKIKAFIENQQNLDTEKLWQLWKVWRDNKPGKKWTTYIGEQRGLQLLLHLSERDLLTAEKIINRSLANNWQGLFPLDSKGKPKETPEQVAARKVDDKLTQRSRDYSAEVERLRQESELD